MSPSSKTGTLGIQANTMRTASCSCGQLTASVTAEPIRVSICHCQACQRRTGSVFGAQARFKASSVKVTGQSREFVRVGDSGGRIEFHFCPNCGATVFYSLDVAPGLIAIPIGAFADPTFPSPRHSVYEQHMHAWVGVPDDIEHLP